MKKEVIVKSRTLGGSSDLTLLAPIKSGFVESLESVTYKTRIKRVLETLHNGRLGSHEYANGHLLSDAVERVGVIQSVRVVVVEPEDKVLLVVTFDGNVDAYIRVLWQKVGSLLDLIFCGTEHYVTSFDHSFDEWKEWVKRRQIETGFFYGAPNTTARDLIYLRRQESLRIRCPDTELLEVQSVLPSAEEKVKNFSDPDPKKVLGVDPILANVPRARMIHERIQGGLQALAGVYRLTDTHIPGTPDGTVLHCAARELLFEFMQLAGKSIAKRKLDEPAIRDRFARQLDWLRNDPMPLIPPLPPIVPRRKPEAPDGKRLPDDVRRDIQGGILRGYENITHGCLLLLSFDNAKTTGEFLAAVNMLLTKDTDEHAATAGKPFFGNLAFTYAGLRVAGLSEEDLELFPEEFRQGMPARAGTLGDVRNNHPRRWRLPLLWDGSLDQHGKDTIELEPVHAVLQLRAKAKDDTELAAQTLSDTSHPLHFILDRLKKHHPRVKLLAVQDMVRNYKESKTKDGKSTKVIAEHFGFEDGNGQPEVENVPAPAERNLVHPGEIILGQDNSADVAIQENDPKVSEIAKKRMRWMKNGSFLVVRKYRQYVDRLEAAVAEATGPLPLPMLASNKANKQELLYAKMMGRFRDGTPLVTSNSTTNKNDFTYDDDPRGEICPLGAHIRLANPRREAGANDAPGARPARLMRRSMSYGPAYQKGESSDVDRGLVFMAYNSSISEQFEVVQRWLTGGNSTGSFSGQSCPFMGVPENGHPRYFRFEDKEKIVRAKLEEESLRFEEPPVATRLEWGMYLFTPSFTALERLKVIALAASPQKPSVPWQLELGRKLIAQLREKEALEGETLALLAWKAALEDPESIRRLESAAIWAAIRKDHGGVLRTPYGVLVASRDAILQVLQDPNQAFSVRGQRKRLIECYGDIYLGMDAGAEYLKQSGPVNDAIGQLKFADVFLMALKAATSKIDIIKNTAYDQALSTKSDGPRRFDVSFDANEILEEVLATVCEEWFGISEKKNYFKRGGADWSWKEGDAPLYPGHFTALSRYMFQPRPGEEVKKRAISYGKALREGMLKFLADANAGPDKDGNGDVIAPIARAIMTHKACETDKDFVANTMVGVLMGLIPTITGAVFGVLEEWLGDGSFWSLRATLAGETGMKPALATIAKPMAEASKMRPMPQVTWRTACKMARVGPEGESGVDIVPGDILVLALVSGTQESLSDGKDDGQLMFGGVRDGKPSQPTHACPGYSAGIAVMAGTLTAFLARKEQMRPGPSPLSFTLEGDVLNLPVVKRKSGKVELLKKITEFKENLKTLKPKNFKLKDIDLKKITLKTIEQHSHTFNEIKAVKALKERGKMPNREGQLVLAWGDSWLDYTFDLDVKDLIRIPDWVPIIPVKLGTDMRDWLEKFNYDIPDTYCSFQDWGDIQDLADESRGNGFYKLLAKSMKLGQKKPKAIILSGGGNDSVNAVLETLLNQNDKNDAAQKHLIDPQAISSHIKFLSENYQSVLNVISDITSGEVKVLVHAYDYPEPRGRGPKGSTQYGLKWMREHFQNKGYGMGDAYDLTKATRAMRDLIDALNEMLIAIVEIETSKGNPKYPFLKYVDLRNTLTKEWPNSTDYEERWADDMHPTTLGFHLMAKKLDDVIQNG
jgi:Dyp-type peroxidase family